MLPKIRPKKKVFGKIPVFSCSRVSCKKTPMFPFSFIMPCSRVLVFVLVFPCSRVSVFVMVPVFSCSCVPVFPCSCLRVQKFGQKKSRFSCSRVCSRVPVFRVHVFRFPCLKKRVPVKFSCSRVIVFPCSRVRVPVNRESVLCVPVFPWRV